MAFYILTAHILLKSFINNVYLGKINDFSAIRGGIGNFMKNKEEKGFDKLAAAFREAAAELKSHEDNFLDPVENRQSLDLKRKLRSPDHLRAMKSFNDARRELLSSGNKDGQKIVKDIERNFSPSYKR